MSFIHRLSLNTTKFLAAALCASGTASGQNLTVEDVAVNFAQQIIKIAVQNTGANDAGEHLTYVEINSLGVSDTAKPQSQYTIAVPGIGAGESWSSGSISFDDFSTRNGFDLSELAAGNIVVTADAKQQVKETNEEDNIADLNHLGSLSFASKPRGQRAVHAAVGKLLTVNEMAMMSVSELCRGNTSECLAAAGATPVLSGAAGGRCTSSLQCYAHNNSESQIIRMLTCIEETLAGCRE